MLLPRVTIFFGLVTVAVVARPQQVEPPPGRRDTISPSLTGVPASAKATPREVEQARAEKQSHHVSGVAEALHPPSLLHQAEESPVGCCFEYGFGAGMVPCCLRAARMREEQCLPPGASSQHLLGGQRGFTVDTCPKTAAQAHSLMQKAPAAAPKEVIDVKPKTTVPPKDISVQPRKNVTALAPENKTVGPQNGTAVQPQNGTAVEPQNGTAVELKNGSAVEPKNLTAAKSQNGTAVELKNGSAVEPKNLTSAESQNSTAGELKSGSAVEPKNLTAVESQNSTAVELKNGTAVEPKNLTAVESQNSTAVELKSGSAVEPKNLTAVEPKNVPMELRKKLLSDVGPRNPKDLLSKGTKEQLPPKQLPTFAPHQPQAQPGSAGVQLHQTSSSLKQHKAEGPPEMPLSGEEELHVSIPGGGIAISTRGATAFRVRVLRVQDLFRRPLDTPMVHPSDADAKFTTVVTPTSKSIRTSFGTLTVTTAGRIILTDSSHSVNVAISEPVIPDSFKLVFVQDSKDQLYGHGASRLDAQTITTSSSTPLVANTATYVPYYWSSDGYGALGVVEHEQAGKLPANYSVKDQLIEWSFGGNFELYLMPSNSLQNGTRAYYNLIGTPPVPPLYAFGFMASRWGWKNSADVEQVIQQFRKLGYPLDAVILDQEWYTEKTDYGFSDQGEATFTDFGFNGAFFKLPAFELPRIKELYGVRVGGIRKPRLGNSELLKLMRSKGGISSCAEPDGTYLHSASKPYAVGRNLNFSEPIVRAWYAEYLAPLLNAGMDFWWNDEGEGDYFTFYWWNVAERMALQSNKRFYSINRAFIPGMAKLGATVWTGDIDATWEDLQRTPGMMLNWALAGAPYVTCDAGGYLGNTTGELLTRWLQVAAFLPTMRVHSRNDATPHWPWLFGEPAAAAIRKALELRYQLLIYHYSYAHWLSSSGELWLRPMAMAFPNDPKAKPLTSQWMDGNILVAPVVNEKSVKNVYLPAGVWYPLGSNTAIEGPRTLTGPATLDEIPAYVLAGTILPIVTGLQHTSQLPGLQPLAVHVYAGQDAKFALVQDDGETLLYEAVSPGGILFSWDNSNRELSWAVEGEPIKGKSFTELYVVLHDRLAAAVNQSATHLIARSGAISFPPLVVTPPPGVFIPSKPAWAGGGDKSKAAADLQDKCKGCSDELTCSACHAGQTTAEYCAIAGHWTLPACKAVQFACCSAANATCLACLHHVTLEQFCLQTKIPIPGCEATRERSSATTTKAGLVVPPVPVALTDHDEVCSRPPPETIAARGVPGSPYKKGQVISVVCADSITTSARKWSLKCLGDDRWEAQDQEPHCRPVVCSPPFDPFGTWVSNTGPQMLHQGPLGGQPDNILHLTCAPGYVPIPPGGAELVCGTRAWDTFARCEPVLGQADKWRSYVRLQGVVSLVGFGAMLAVAFRYCPGKGRQTAAPRPAEEVYDME